MPWPCDSHSASVSWPPAQINKCFRPAGNGYDPLCLRAPLAQLLLSCVQLSVDSIVPEASPSVRELSSPLLWSALSPPSAFFRRSAAVWWRSFHCHPQPLVLNAKVMMERARFNLLALFNYGPHSYCSPFYRFVFN